MTALSPITGNVSFVDLLICILLFVVESGWNFPVSAATYKTSPDSLVYVPVVL